MEEQGFYPSNNKVLKFDVNRDVDEIRFNHYIMQKENFQRMKCNLPRGQFYMSINLVSKDLSITFAKARGLIKKFAESGIITNVYTPPKGCKNLSIWKYNSAQKINNDSNNENSNDTNNDKCSNTNSLSHVANNDINNENNNDINNTKKEYIKTINKNNNSAQNAQAEKLWRVYPLKKNKARVINKIPKLIEKYGFEQMKNTISRYKKYVEDTRNKGFKELKYQNGSTFFNGTYEDYLDKNYEEQEHNVSESNVQMFDFDE
ncbi:hypothetical protein ACJDU8_22440 [Clostridium sp. WILCCON 0269]|uniref:Uncharacterized protein n=1 Tax=Candidatus Clostridium eludens TaxID=3381663 RepID=A0ABW8SQU1_9CLOT